MNMLPDKVKPKGTVHSNGLATELTEILSVSDIGNKWLGNPFKNRSVQCGHICIFLCNPNLLEPKSDSERISVSSVWPSLKEVSIPEWNFK